MFWLRNKKNSFQLRSLIWGPGSNVKVPTDNELNYGYNGLRLFSLFSFKMYIMGVCKNPLGETLLLCTHKIYYGWK